MGDKELKARQIISEKLGPEESEVIDTASFEEDLNADSLDKIELIMAFEDEFDIDIPDEDAADLKTVGQAIEYLKGKW